MSRPDRHGGDVYAAVRESGLPLARITDFSASINPLGPAPAVHRAILTAMPLAAAYPDPECTTLREALSKRYSLSPRCFLIGNGSTELIHLLPRALGLCNAVIVGPTFSEYERSLKLAGVRVTWELARRHEGYRPPLERATTAAKAVRSRSDAMYLCNPNSPTGQGVGPRDVMESVRNLARRGIWCIVDETFVEYAANHSVIGEIMRQPRLLVLRSFTKFFALPGLRIGYLVAQPVVIERIKAMLPPWSANTLAQAAGLAALRDRRHIRRSLTFMVRERERLARRLSRIPGLVVFPSLANFLLLELPPGHSSRTVTKALRERGMLIRDCSAVPGLSKRSIRVAVRRPGENNRLVTALSTLID